MLLVDPHESPITLSKEVSKKIIKLLKTLSATTNDLKNIIDTIQHDYNHSFWSSYKTHEQEVKEMIDAQEEYCKELDRFYETPEAPY